MPWYIMKEKEKWEKFWGEKGEDVEDLLKAVEEESFRIRNILKYLPKGKVLDTGCENGKYVFYLERLGYEVYGIDYAEETIEINRKISQKSGLGEPSRFKVMDVCQLDFPDNYFDGYLSLGTIQHLSNPQAALREAYRVLRKGGTIFITVPNKISPRYPARELVVKLGRGNLPLVYREYTRRALKELASSIGFKCVALFNCNTMAAFRVGFMLESPKVVGLPNLFYYARGLFYQIADKLERSFPTFGFHSVFVGRKE